MTEPSRKTRPILPGEAGSNGTLGPSGPPGHLEEMRPMGKDGQPGVPLSAGPTYPNPVEQLERPQTNSRGKSVSCRGGFAGFRGICYKVFRVKQSFSEAAATCGENGGTLAMPRDAQINDFLISLYRYPGHGMGFKLWFGLQDRRKEGKFEWVDGSPLAEYNSWARARPSRGPSGSFRDCVLYTWCWHQTCVNRWSDAPCAFRVFFICQVFPGDETA
ncbi:collectin-10-like [Branchiostoma lanceolatum]|uniref:collectin-10-like n=1 Tax=Branchiostoma lanceolatum TaxID=7740 RepID=UPI003453D61D